MNLDFSDEHKALKEELARLLSHRFGLKSARAALEGVAGYDAELWRELGELGWLSVATPEAYGGQGLGYEMLCCVAEEIGRSMAALPFGSTIYLGAEALLLFGNEMQKQNWLSRIGRGDCIAAFAIAEQGGSVCAKGISASVTDGVLNGAKIAVSDGMAADLLIVGALDGDRPGLFLVDATAPGIERDARSGIDPAHAPASIRFCNVRCEPLATTGWDDVERLIGRAAVLFAFEQLGTADASLVLALDYVRERKAFGRRVGSFQALKHKLADVWIANELARSNAYYAAWALEADTPELSLAAATARVAASEALERAARELIQVHGGIAVTWEHDAHLFYRRGQHLNVVLGGLHEWQDRLVDHLADAA